MKNEVAPMLANIDSNFMDKPRSLSELMNEFGPVFGIPSPEQPEQTYVAPLLPFPDSELPSNERHLDTIIDGLYPMGICTECD